MEGALYARTDTAEPDIKPPGRLKRFTLHHLRRAAPTADAGLVSAQPCPSGCRVRGMPINDWWTDDPTQKYWIEITDRDDIGAELRAPQLADDDKPEWGYELVRFVRPDDVVLHWRAVSGHRDLIGYSRVTGPAYEATWAWQSKGTSGRARTGPEVEEPAWMAPLAGLTLFPAPLTRAQLQTYKVKVLDLKARLTEAYGGASLYFPFYEYGGKELRVTQAYMAKFPAQLLTLFGLDAVPGAQAARKAVEPGRRSRRGSGYLSDVKLKRAVERHAVGLVRKRYEAEGYTCRDVGSTHSYDLHLTKGSEEIHVEVKGSTGTADTVRADEQRSQPLRSGVLGNSPGRR